MRRGHTARPQLFLVPGWAGSGGDRCYCAVTDANLVLVDVVVTERAARCTGSQSRFHVYEDGREQPIASFDEHTGTALEAASARLRFRRGRSATFRLTRRAGGECAASGWAEYADGQPDRRAAGDAGYLARFRRGHRWPFSRWVAAAAGGSFTTDAAELAKVFKSPGAGPQTSWC